MRTERLELADQDLRDWEATVLDATPEGIVLSRSAFYPGGGGQPADQGTLLWQGVETRIAGVRKGDDLYLIPAEGDPLPAAGTVVRAALADERRSALMRTHSGLHVLCGVVFRDYGALVTGGNMDVAATPGVVGTARMDFNLPEVPPGFKEAVEAACNAEIVNDRRIDVRVLPRGEAFAIPTSSARRPISCRRMSRTSGSSTSWGSTRQADGGTPRRLDPADRAGAGRQDREQGQGVPPGQAGGLRLGQAAHRRGSGLGALVICHVGPAARARAGR